MAIAGPPPVVWPLVQPVSCGCWFESERSCRRLQFECAYAFDCACAFDSACACEFECACAFKQAGWPSSAAGCDLGLVWEEEEEKGQALALQRRNEW